MKIINGKLHVTQHEYDLITLSEWRILHNGSGYVIFDREKLKFPKGFTRITVNNFPTTMINYYDGEKPTVFYSEDCVIDENS